MLFLLLFFAFMKDPEPPPHYTKIGCEIYSSQASSGHYAGQEYWTVRVWAMLESGKWTAYLNQFEAEKTKKADKGREKAFKACGVWEDKHRILVKP